MGNEPRCVTTRSYRLAICRPFLTLYQVVYIIVARKEGWYEFDTRPDY